MDEKIDKNILAYEGSIAEVVENEENYRNINPSGEKARITRFSRPMILRDINGIDWATVVQAE